MGKGEIAPNEQFPLFPQCFLLNQIIVSPFFHISDIISLLAVELEEPKTGISGKWLIVGIDITIIGNVINLKKVNLPNTSWSFF